MTQKQQKRLAVAGVILFCVVMVLICWRVGVPMVRLVSEPETFRQWVDQYGWAGKLLYMGMVIIQIVAAFIPGEPLEIAGGYAFGAVEGTVLCLLADTMGSLLVFLLVRRFGMRLVRLFFSQENIRSARFLQSSPRRTFLFLIVFMIPGTPKDLLCYFAGLTDMRLPVLLLIASLGRIPSVVTSAVGGDALGAKSYGFAAVVFVITLTISIVGLMIYHKLSHQDKPE